MRWRALEGGFVRGGLVDELDCFAGGEEAGFEDGGAVGEDDVGGLERVVAHFWWVVVVGGLLESGWNGGGDVGSGGGEMADKCSSIECRKCFWRWK